MAGEVDSLSHLTEVISHVVAPSFLLGAVASFIAMLFSRMNTVLDRIRFLNSIPVDDPERGNLKADIPRLRRRTRLMHVSIQLAIGSGIVTTVLMITAFTIAMLGYDHLWGSAGLFILALAFFFASLVALAAEVTISVSEYDHY